MALAELAELQTQPLPHPSLSPGRLLQQMAEQGGGNPPQTGPCPAPGGEGGGPPA